MTPRGHFEEFAASVVGDFARCLTEAYREALDDPTMTEADIASRLKAVMEAKVTDPVDASPEAID